MIEETNLHRLLKTGHQRCSLCRAFGLIEIMRRPTLGKKLRNVDEQKCRKKMIKTVKIQNNLGTNIPSKKTYSYQYHQNKI